MLQVTDWQWLVTVGVVDDCVSQGCMCIYLSTDTRCMPYGSSEPESCSMTCCRTPRLLLLLLPLWVTSMKQVHTQAIVDCDELAQEYKDCMG